MQIRVGFEMAYRCPQPTPMILVLNIHYSRASDLVRPDLLITSPAVPITMYRDLFGNWCSRLVAPPGRFVLTHRCARQRQRRSRTSWCRRRRRCRSNCCPSRRWSFCSAAAIARPTSSPTSPGNVSAHGPTGWARVQAICDFVHHHIEFGYHHARRTRTAWEAYNEGVGVCRDYAHLAIALCRCMNIPARYCTGYLGDMGTPPPWGTMDFAGWFEAWLGDRWYTFDARNNTPRIGRVLMARGRDASDVALSSTFGPNTLEGFRVWADEVQAQPVV